jgi:AcrR family transcriptional regulator
MNGTGLISRRDKKRSETKQRIFAEAMRLFAEKGYQSTTVDEITEAADVAKGTFFNYFQTKEAVLQDFARLQMSRIEQARDEMKSGGNVREVVRHMVRNLYKEPSQSRNFTRGFIGMGLANPEVAALLSQTMKKGRGLLAEIFEEGRRSGQLRSRLSSETLAAVTQRTMFGTLVIWALTGESDLVEIIDQNLECLWQGFGTTE